VWCLAKGVETLSWSEPQAGSHSESLSILGPSERRDDCVDRHAPTLGSATPPFPFGAHSLRSGFLTSAARRGASVCHWTSALRKTIGFNSSMRRLPPFEKKMHYQIRDELTLKPVIPITTLKERIEACCCRVRLLSRWCQSRSFRLNTNQPQKPLYDRSMSLLAC
jgi:hypothetical protein